MRQAVSPRKLTLCHEAIKAHRWLFNVKAMSTAPDAPASTSASSPLLTPVKVGNIQLSHRIAMEPLTRLRMTPGTELPNDLNTLYYEQRTSQGGLMVAECAYATPDGRGYVRAPGLATDAQAAAWRPAVDRVHSKGGVFFAQIFHAGRVSHSSLVGNKPTVSASPVACQGALYVEGGVKVPYEVPRELSTEEVRQLPGVFARSAEKAVKLGGFDGVELHGANGYLLQSFLAKKTNSRTDEYGGPIANRSRLLLEVVDAVAAAIGPHRTAIKLQPGVTFSDLIEPEEDVRETLDYLAPELSKRNLSYVKVSTLNGEPYFRFAGLSAPNVSFDVFRRFRERYTGTLAINGGLGIEQGERYVSEGVADVVFYGVPFIANANLPALVAGGVRTEGLNPGSYDMKTWYGRNPADDVKGYTDWPLVVPGQQQQQ